MVIQSWTINRLEVDAHKCGTLAMHSSSPVCKSNSTAECVVLTLKDPDGLSLQPFTFFQCITDWPSKLLSTVCLIWAFCLHLSLSLQLKTAALPRFASLCLAIRHSAVRRMTIMRPGCLPLLHTKLSHLYQAHCVLPYSCKVLLKQCAINDGSHLYTAHKVCVFYVFSLLQFLVVYSSLFLY